MKKLAFPKDFIWGAASASYQVEGAFSEDGRGESIWDRYCRIPGMVANGDTGDRACDQYHRYQEDIGLMQKLGIGGYRFSIAWPRIFPGGFGKANPQGLDYYDRLADALLKAGIMPFVTLYHWDLPQALQDRGGWANPDTAKYFADYCAAVYEKLNGRVPYWMTLNEPYCSSFLGNYVGRHAPGGHDYALALRAAYYLYVGHGFAVQAFREKDIKGEMGIALNLMGRLPYDPEAPADRAAASRADGNLNRWFLDPIIRGAYPEDMLEWYRNKGLTLPPFDDKEITLMKQPLDFIALNYYNDFYVRANPDVFPDEFEIKNRRYMPVNTRGWPITESGFTGMLLRLKNEYNIPRIMISENGTSTHDIITMDHKVEDPQRIDYLRRHIAALHRAIEQGVNVFAYMQWSLTDNFEWAFGYDSRFGLIYIDFETQKRIIKSSGAWYAKLIAENAVEIP
jgi:beta-glucosidase